MMIKQLLIDQCSSLWQNPRRAGYPPANVCMLSSSQPMFYLTQYQLQAEP